ncbi:hypothetical protein HHI_15808 [Hyphomonas hirschiana VP5]|uniref:DUF2029 domain-containing protein n=2 Tax=Hyphomonas TaxID=85 RepID=A0A059FAA3_9PROT|nr:hypothetical protein HHI_15808 [Hyphomonas hirschiana VP5]
MINGVHFAGAILGFFLILRLAGSERYSHLMWPVALVWGAIMTVIVFVNTLPSPEFIFWDFVKCYWLAGDLIWNGPQALAGAYDADSLVFVNLPIVAYLFAPFGLMSPMTGAILLTLVGLPVVALIWRLLVKMYALDSRDSALLFFALCVFGPLLYSFKVGNTSHFVLALILGGMAMGRSGKGFAAGALFGVAAVIKPALLLIGVLYFLRGRWNVVAGGAAVIAGSAALSLLIFGWDMHVLWYETTIAPYASSTVSAYGNQTLQGLVARFEVGGPAGHDYDPYTLSAAGRLAAQGLALLLVLGAVFSAWYSRRLTRPTNDDIEIELMMAVTLAMVVSTVSWVHYYVWILPAIVALWVRTRPGDVLAGWRWPLVGAFALSAGTAFVSHSMTVGRFGPLSNFVASHWLWGALIILGMLALLRAKQVSNREG